MTCAWSSGADTPGDSIRTALTPNGQPRTCSHDVFASVLGCSRSADSFSAVLRGPRQTGVFARWSASLLVVLGAALRFHRLGFQSLWFDELFSLRRAATRRCGRW